MIATDMMEYIESDLVIFGTAVAIIFALCCTYFLVLFGMYCYHY